MAVRQQQRRGTAAQWTAANPILSAAEIGFEIDTNKFKIGDGTNRWADLTYFTADAAQAIQDLLDGAPGVLDTLNELAASLGDNPDFIGTMTTNLAAKAPLASPTFTGTVSGITKSMVGLGNVDNTADSAKQVSTAQATAIATAKSEATSTAAADATAKVAAEATARDTAIATAKSEAITAAGTAADTKVSTAVAALTKSSVGLGNVDNTSDANKPVSSATQTALDAKLASATASSTYAPIVSPIFTGTVSGITKSMVGLGSVDNTADSAKPVSTATQTALDLKADLASPALTGTPSAPTASFSTDSTQIATTAFVKSVLNNIGSLNLVLDGGGVSQ